MVCKFQDKIETLIAVLPIVDYATTYYILFWRSKDYRAAFLAPWKVVFPGFEPRGGIESISGRSVAGVTKTWTLGPSVTKTNIVKVTPQFTSRILH